LSSKAQVGARHVARMRGAFNRPRLAMSGAGRLDKPEAKAGAAGATRANGARKGGRFRREPGECPTLDFLAINTPLL